MGDWFDKVASSSTVQAPSWFHTIAKKPIERSEPRDPMMDTKPVPAGSKMTLADLPRATPEEAARLKAEDAKIQPTEIPASTRIYDVASKALNTVPNAVADVMQTGQIAGEWLLRQPGAKRLGLVPKDLSPDQVDTLIQGGRAASPATAAVNAVRSATLPTVPGMEDSIPGKVATGLGYVGQALATGGGAVALGAMEGGSGAFVGTYEQAKARGADENSAFAAGLEAGGVGALAGLIKLDTLVKINKASGGMFAKALEDAVVFGGVSGAQTALNETITKHATDEDILTLASLGDTLRKAGVEAGVGTIVGALSGAGTYALHAKASEAKPTPDAQPEPAQSATEPVGARAVNAGSEAPPRGQNEPVRGGFEGARGTEEQVRGDAPVEPANKISESTGQQPAPDAGTTETAKPSPEPSQASVTPPEPVKPPLTGEGDPVSPANESMERDLTRLGFELPPDNVKRTFQEKWAEAKRIVTEDPTAGKKLLNDLEATNRPPRGVENGILAHEITRLTNEYEAALKAYNEDPSPANEATKNVAEIDYTRASDILVKAGGESSDSLNFRRFLVNRDFSLARMAEVVRAKQGGEPLSSEQESRLVEIRKRLDDFEAKMKELDERTRNTAFDNETTKLKRQVVRVSRAKPGVVRSYIHTRAEEARARFKSGNVARSFESVISDAAWIGADYIAQGVSEFGAWSKAMVQEIGSRTDEQMKALFDESQRAAAQGHLDALRERATTRFKEGRGLGGLPNALARHFIEQGVSGRDALIDAVHGELVKIDKGLTREGARDAIIEYGKATYPSSDETSKTLRGYKQEMLQLAKLDSLAKKQVPPKTGPQRDEQTTEARRLGKQVREKMKELGLKPINPDQHLKTQLESTKTRLRNQIEDLTHEIERRELDVESPRTPASDAEVEALRTQLADVRKQHEDIFGKPGMTDEQRAQAALKATEKSLAEYERRVRENDLSKHPENQGPPTAEVARLRAQREATAARRDALRAQLEDMRSAMEPPKPDPLDKRIADLEAKIAAGDTSTAPPKQTVPTEKQARLKTLQDRLAKMRADAKPKTSTEERLQRSLEKRIERIKAGIEAPGPKQGPPTEAVSRLRDELDALRAERSRNRKAAEDPKTERKVLTAEERELERLHNRQDELLIRLDSGDLSTKNRGKATVDTEAVAKARAEVDALTQQIEAMRKAANPPMTPEHRAIKAAMTASLNRTARLKEKAMYGDFSVREKKPPVSSPELVEQQAEELRIKRMFEREKLKAERANRTKGKIALDTAREVLELSSDIKTGFDLSALGRQGFFFLVNHPIISGRQIPDMMRAFRNERASDRVEAMIQNDPDFVKMKKAGFDFTGMDDRLSAQEENLRSRWGKKIPLLGASGRAYKTFLNLQRFHIGKSLIDSIKVDASPDDIRSIARMVNDATGRGHSDSPKIESFVNGVRPLLFAPRYYLSALHLLTGSPLRRATPATRRIIAKEYGVHVVAISSVIALAALAGFKVGTDPDSPDFLKIRDGDTTIDLTAGKSQYIVLGSRVTQAVRGAMGADIPKGRPRNVEERLADFVRGKLSPGARLVVDLLNQKQMDKTPTTPTEVARSLAEPLVVGDIIKSIQSQGWGKGAAYGALSLFGVGVNNYKAKK